MKSSKKLLSLLLVLCMVLSLTCTAFAAEGTTSTSMAGKTVILHSNDVHGAIEGYAKIAALKADYEAKGAEVILADAGDYFQGTAYVSTTKGANAVDMMNTAGYDIATIGNHEFDYGYENLVNIMKEAKFEVVCADVAKDGEPIFDANTIIEKGGVKIGFFGLETPEAQTKANPALIKGLEFVAGEKLYACAQAQVNALKEKGADIIICLAHLGVDEESEPNRSADMYDHVTGIDFVIDGHSHSVMAAGVEKIQTGEEDGAPVYAKNPFASKPIQSTGTAFANVGVIVIDNATKKIESNNLVSMADYEGSDATVAAAAKTIIDKINAEYGVVFAKSEVALNGDRDPGNRTEETNLGDLITDSMIWSVLKEEGSIKVPAENIVAITNGGGIRASISKGDITKKDVNTVLPFGNTVAVVYVTGAELLEALEASTYCTRTAVGGFPQVSGMSFIIDTTQAYDANEETYPGSTYYGPKSINRVTITDINGNAFDEKATYAVVTNNFCAAGGDTYYAFASASEQFDTGIPLDEALMDYIKEELGGVVGFEYAEAAGRISVWPNPFTDVDEDDWFYTSVEAMYRAGVIKGMTPRTFEPKTTVSRAMVVTTLYRLAADQSIPEDAACPFTDVKEGDWFYDAAVWAYDRGILLGTTPTTAEPNATATREQVATMIYRFVADPSVVPTNAQLDEILKVYSDAAKISSWAKLGVAFCTDVGLMQGDEGGFRPQDLMTRAELAELMTNLVRAAAEQPDEMPEVPEAVTAAVMAA